MTTLIKRRQFLAGATALAASGALLTSQLSFAAAKTEARFVFVILRGALDGLTAVPPYGDVDYAGLRGSLALAAPGAVGGAFRLDDRFALHPSLAFMSESFSAGELTVFHAVASPYRERSHFDGQDVIENGHLRPHAAQTGWLNRALSALPVDRSFASREQGVALGQNVPLVMRGEAPVASWSPSKLAALDEDTLGRITDLYAGDKVLSRRLADALRANTIAMKGRSMSGADANMRGPARFMETVTATAAFLRRDDGPRVAVFDTTGWDTHANEGAEQGQLAGRLAALDSGLRELKQGLGEEVWPRTMVLLVTEFGRTAATNGTRGTDHGTGSAAFLLGGAVAGGRVVADWPGLAPGALYQARDLAPTLDMRSVIKGVMSEHLRVSTRALDNEVFPDSRQARPLTGLVRA